MADFVAVLRKTIDGLGETTPEVRARVYDKARATISAKLAQMNPPPPAAVVERQKASLEQAIAALEAEYASPDLDDFEALVAPPAPDKGAADATPSRPLAGSAPSAGLAPMPPTAANQDPVEARARPAAARRSGSRRGGMLAFALIVLAFLGAAGYAVWLNRDEVGRMLGLNDGPPPVAPVVQAPEPEPEAEPAEETPAPAAEPAPPAPQKFTQRLNADGTETDTGPAGEPGGVGEGTSVATLTVPPDGQAPAQPAQPTAEAPATPPPASTSADPALAVGQRAIFYEERTTASEGSAEQGSTVWSLVRESPGGDLPPEPAIRAEVTVPAKDLQLRLTIRRNGDKTLPASHIVELIFLTPENFQGGVIDNFLRMTMKETEEATGNPVLGLPAKIGDGFFLLAMTDSAPEVEANMQLFRRMKWIDLPIVYRSGRRALMTLERGIPGDQVFEEAMKAWAASSG